MKTVDGGTTIRCRLKATGGAIEEGQTHEIGGTADDVVSMEVPIRKMCYRLWASMPALRASWGVDDLVQEAFLRALVVMERHKGRASLKTFSMVAARNYIISMARHAAHHPVSLPEVEAQTADLSRDARDVREATKVLLRWLKDTGEVEKGWEVLNLLLWNHGDFDRVATAMSVHTGRPWTTERVRNVVRRIRCTPKGRALCEAVGIPGDEQED